MKRIITILTGLLIGYTSLAQTDSTQQTSDTTRQVKQGDTIRIGNIIIVKRQGDDDDHRRNIRIDIRHRFSRSGDYKPSNLSTNWFVVDLGFANYNDQTEYASTAIQDPTSGFAPGATKDWFKLRPIKSVNVNIWLFMQRLNLIQHVVNLKYGVGVELNNYRYDEPVKFRTSPTQAFLDKSTEYKKNKLAADYATVPLMLNFNFTPKKKRPIGISAGASFGYLYSSRQKTITEADGKRKKNNDFDLRPWKLAYIAELNLGPVKLYGSYATQSMFEKGLDQTPYAIGFRISSW